MVNILWPEQLKSRLAALGKQSLITNAGFLMGISLLNALVGFLFWGFAAHLYSPEDIGFTSAVLSAALLICGLTDFGMSVGLVRYLPEIQRPIKFLNTVYSVEILTSLLAGVIYLTGISIWTPSLTSLKSNWVYYIGFLIYITFFTLGSLISRSFIARRKSIYAFFYNCISNGSRLILVILLVSFGSAGLPASLTIAFTLATSISILLILPKTEHGYRFHPDFNLPMLAKILPYSLGNYVVGLLSMVSQRLLPILIIEILGPTSNGHFYIAWMIGDFLHSPSSALSDATFAEGSNSPERLNSFIKRSATIGLGLTIPAAVLVGVVAPHILILFGQTYAQEATALLRWLALSAPLTAISSLYATNLRVRKQIIQLVLLSSIYAVVILGVTYVLIPSYGITAVGISSLIGNGLMALVGIIGLGWHKTVIGFFLITNHRKESSPSGGSSEI